MRVISEEREFGSPNFRGKCWRYSSVLIMKMEAEVDVCEREGDSDELKGRIAK